MQNSPINLVTNPEPVYSNYIHVTMSQYVMVEERESKRIAMRYACAEGLRNVSDVQTRIEVPKRVTLACCCWLGNDRTISWLTGLCQKFAAREHRLSKGRERHSPDSSHRPSNRLVRKASEPRRIPVLRTGLIAHMEDATGT
jgi:hypothetical protein